MSVIPSRLLLRRATSILWASANPVLQAGEPGVATDTGTMKVGDGVTAYNLLPALLSVPIAAVAAAAAFLSATSAAAQRAVLGLTSNATFDAVGTYVLVDGTVAPALSLKANGAAISRTTYAALFAKIGTRYGVGDGATTFNLPDWRGEFGRGFDDGRGVDAGRVFGSAQADAIESHTHPVTGNTNSAGSHDHTQGVSSYGPWGTKYGTTGGAVTTSPSGANGASLINPLTSTEGAHTHTVTGTATATGGTETRSRNLAWLVCIRYA